MEPPTQRWILIQELGFYGCDKKKKNDNMLKIDILKGEIKCEMDLYYFHAREAHSGSPAGGGASPVMRGLDWGSSTAHLPPQGLESKAGQGVPGAAPLTPA